jgi:hypothetical protein
MFLDYEQTTGDDGLVRAYFTEPGRDGTLHSWEVRDGETGDGISIRATERREIRLGDLGIARAFAFLGTAVFGVTSDVAFELDRGQFHRYQRNGFCSNHMHQACDSKPMPQPVAERIWSALQDRFHPSSDDVWVTLTEELHRVGHR